MNLDIVLEELLPHPVEAVWSALTDRGSISDWLMQAPGFEPVVGTRFRMKTQNLSADGWVKAEVTELDPPRRMVWAWWVDDAAPTTVTFELAPEGGGTRLRLTHVGEINPIAGALVRDGWPGRLEQLRRTLDQA
ncbi:MAG TPA: SRPBCC domain-containing protein [Gaiellaceae bacterium]|nr:SRPBCC domain-containing protein [Gaiellaceae bacterium]